VLDLIGKATPGTFQPSLQIDGTGAKLLIEALSGRWSYDTIGGKKERFGTTSLTRFRFSYQRWRQCRATNKSR